MSLTEQMVHWKEEYSVGNTEIDREHQKLFSLAKKALDVINIESENHAKLQLKEIIDELSFYVGTHFTNEQEFMHKIDYPDLAIHTKKHKQITQDLHVLISSLGKMTLTEVHEKISDFVENVFIRHILEDDLQIKIWNKCFDEIQKTFDWKQSYDTCNAQIDKEHKELFAIATRAYERVGFAQREDKIREVLNRIYDYMKSHFHNEEEFMKETGYPAFQEHRQMHLDIVKRMNRFVIQLPHANEELFEKELAHMIDEAFVEHIKNDDEEFRVWLEKQK